MKVLLLLALIFCTKSYAAETFKQKAVRLQETSFINFDTEIDIFAFLLKKTARLDFESRFRILNQNRVPFPYPNMYFSYMTPEESVDTFVAFYNNQFNDKKTFHENWQNAVSDYNKIHKSLPIQIPSDR